jgi:hypothetical protein
MNPLEILNIDPSLINQIYGYSGSGNRPDKSILQQISESAYSDNPASQIGNFKLFKHTKTLKFYIDENDKTIIVGIRGTKPTDFGDIKADLSIPFGRLNKSNRFQEDLDVLKNVQSQYPPSVYDYYGTGHSLGGALLDEFLEMGLLKSGRSYNPAVQPKHFKDQEFQPENERVYAENDPLLALGKEFIPEYELRPERNKTYFEKMVTRVPYLGKIYNYLSGHKLEQFRGGKKFKYYRKDLLKLAKMLKLKNYSKLNMKDLEKLIQSTFPKKHNK